MKGFATVLSLFAAVLLFYSFHEFQGPSSGREDRVGQVTKVASSISYQQAETISGPRARAKFREMADLDDLYDALLGSYLERIIVRSDATEEAQKEAEDRAEYRLSLIVFALADVEAQDVDARCITNVLMDPSYGENAIYQMSQLIVEGTVVDYFSSDLLDGFGSSVLVKSEKALKGAAPEVITIRQASSNDEWLSTDLRPNKGDRYTFFLSNGLYRYREMLFRDETGPHPFDHSLDRLFVRVFDEIPVGTFKIPVCNNSSNP